MKGFYGPLEKLTASNTNFRQVIYTGHHTQLVLMQLLPGEEIGEEVHQGTDQFFRIESGSGKCVIDGNEYILAPGDGIIVPSGAGHNVINTSPDTPLKLYTLYSPPHHQDGLVKAIKELAAKEGIEFDGKTTE